MELHCGRDGIRNKMMVMMALTKIMAMLTSRITMLGIQKRTVKIIRNEEGGRGWSDNDVIDYDIHDLN